MTYPINVNFAATLHIELPSSPKPLKNYSMLQEELSSEEDNKTTVIQIRDDDSPSIKPEEKNKKLPHIFSREAVKELLFSALFGVLLPLLYLFVVWPEK